VKKKMKKIMMVIGISSLCVLSACSTNNSGNQNMQQKSGGQSIKQQQNGQNVNQQQNRQNNVTQQQSDVAKILSNRVIVRATGESNTALVPYRPIDGQVWLPLDKAVEIYDYHYFYDPESQKITIGYTDPLFELTVGKKEAKIQENTVALTDALRMVDGEPVITTRSLSELWQTPIQWDNQNRIVTIVTPDDGIKAKSIEVKAVSSATITGTGSLRTGPNTSSRVIRSMRSGEKVTVLSTPNRYWYQIQDNSNVKGYISSRFLRVDGGASVTRLPSAAPNTSPAAPANADVNKLISFAKRFMGVPYKFASGAYASTRTFDCSSFTQYVFRNSGLSIPRSSRSQAQTGTTVDRSQIQPGDLLFFSVPGRFANNRTVGHVGIYMGNNQLIHTFGAPGVTITNFAGTWDKRFLFAKRIR
jgi:cell wall-associated NlpC family hydrolase